MTATLDAMTVAARSKFEGGLDSLRACLAETVYPAGAVVRLLPDEIAQSFERAVHGAVIDAIGALPEGQAFAAANPAIAAQVCADEDDIHEIGEEEAELQALHHEVKDILAQRLDPERAAAIAASFDGYGYEDFLTGVGQAQSVLDTRTVPHSVRRTDTQAVAVRLTAALEDGDAARIATALGDAITWLVRLPSFDRKKLAPLKEHELRLAQEALAWAALTPDALDEALGARRAPGQAEPARVSAPATGA